MKVSLWPVVFIVCGLLRTSSVHAGFLYVEVFDGSTTLTVIDGSPNDIDPDPNSVIIRSSSLLAAFAGKLNSGSSVSSSTNFATAAVDGISSMSTQYTLRGLGVVSNFTITSGQTGFTVPGDPKSLSTSGSFTFTNSGTLGTGSFQGSVGTTDGASNVFDTLITATSLGNAPNSGTGNGTGTVFSNGNSPYSVQNVLKAHIVSTKNAVIQGQGTTIIDVAVPEPSTIVLLATFCVPVALGCAFRRKAA